MTETSELINQIEIVARTRQAAGVLRQQVRDGRTAWEADNRELLDLAAEQQEVVTQAEARLRELTIEAYSATGNKKPVEGVGIRELMKLDYDPKTALSWATEHKIALALDKKAFEGIAKQSPLEFVTSTQEIQATIASELAPIGDE